MERREFTKLLGLSAVAISTSGFVRYDGTKYEGDCETTSDILGPFYRPNSPVRNNLVISDASGGIVELNGVIRHKDCISPFKGAKIELWHCSADGVYDNDSDEFRYRATTFCDDKGQYSFTTQMPVPYDVGNNETRPAHFHLLVSAKSYQSLITQIYFTGDPHLQQDAYSATPRAAGRILEVKDQGGMAQVFFDVNMNDKLLASSSALDKIIGLYKNEAGKEKELFQADNRLWMKNEVYGQKFDYVGENLFEYSGMPTGMKWSLHFGFIAGEVKLTETHYGENGDKTIEIYKKI